MGIYEYIHRILIEPDSGTAKPEALCCANKLQEVWNGNRELVEEMDLELLEERRRHLRENRFQIITGTTELEPAKVRKRDVCRDWHVDQFPLNITIWDRRVKADPKCLE